MVDALRVTRVTPGYGGGNPGDPDGSGVHTTLACNAAGSGPGHPGLAWYLLFPLWLLWRRRRRARPR